MQVLEVGGGLGVALFLEGGDAGQFETLEVERVFLQGLHHQFQGLALEHAVVADGQGLCVAGHHGGHVRAQPVGLLIGVQGLRPMADGGVSLGQEGPGLTVVGIGAGLLLHLLDHLHDVVAASDLLSSAGPGLGDGDQGGRIAQREIQAEGGDGQ